MAVKLSRNDVRRLVGQAASGMRHEQCRTCDCFLGFLTQLALDADSDVSDILAEFKIERDAMHGCLGCEPCPPAEAYARYLQKKDKDQAQKL